MMVKWELPLRTVSESNRNEHWSVKRKRHQFQQFMIRSVFKNEVNPIYLPCTVVLTRIGPRTLDIEENLPMAFKWIKDEIGACLFPEKVVIYKNRHGRYVKNKGHADSDSRITWKYAQEKGRPGIRIEFIPLLLSDPN
jgi:hypothetical protein